MVKKKPPSLKAVMFISSLINVTYFRSYNYIFLVFFLLLTKSLFTETNAKQTVY